MKVEILSMHLYRDTWEQVQQITKNHGALPDSYWWEFMGDIYAVTQAVAVRRQVDTHKDVASLGKLISEIADDPVRITREFWLGLWDINDRFKGIAAERAWAQQYGGEVGDHLDPAIPANDLDEMFVASSQV